MFELHDVGADEPVAEDKALVDRGGSAADGLRVGRRDGREELAVVHGGAAGGKRGERGASKMERGADGSGGRGLEEVGVADPAVGAVFDLGVGGDIGRAVAGDTAPAIPVVAGAGGPERVEGR